MSSSASTSYSPSEPFPLQSQHPPSADALEQALALAMEIYQADLGLLSLEPPGFTGLRKEVAIGFPPEADPFLGSPFPPETPCATAFEEKRPVIIEDIDTDPHFQSSRDFARASGFRSAQCTPMIASDGQVYGTLTLCFARPHRLSPQASGTLIKYAGQVALIVEGVHWRRQAMQEIDERILAERELGASEQRYRQLVENLPAAAYTCDSEGRIQLFNQAAVTLWGRAPQASDRWCVARRVYSSEGFLLPYEAWPIVLAVEKGILSLGQEVQLEREDGSRRDVMAHPMPIRDEGGKVIGAINLLVDTTDHKRNQLEVRRLAAIVESSDDAIISTDLEGVILSWNTGAQQLYGYSASEVVGQHINVLIPDERHDEEPAIIQRVRQGERIQHYETVRRRQDGSLVHVSLTVSPVKDQEGRILGISKSARDIGHLRHIEDELRRADLRKNEFLATLAHELRNPLAPLQNGLNIIKASHASEEILLKTEDMMERQLRLLVRLVDDLMDVNRITQGKFELRKEVVSLEQTIRNAVESCTPQLQRAEQKFSLDLPPEPILLHADPARLSQVFLNLLTNASKYTPHGGNISLSVYQEGDEAIIKIRDTGIGIPSHMLEDIFTLFMQVDRSLEKSTGGLGIGLTLVKQLVEMHQGTVTAFSEGKDLGSEFTVRLPVRSVLSPDTAAPQESHTDRPLRVLVVDDNEDSAMSMALMLKILGHETQDAGDGLQAIEAANAFRPDLIIMDIGMPRLNGYEACRRIRSETWGQQMAIVALTGWGQAEDRKKSEESGFDGHLVKPVDMTALTSLLDRFGKRSR